MNQSVAIAFDIGGTKTIVGLVDSEGSILEREQYPTAIDRPLAQWLDLCAEAAERLLARQGLTAEQTIGVGITVPGLANARTGVLLYAPHAGWRDVPVRELVAARYGLPLRVEVANDVNACALGELVFGAAPGSSDLLWVTVSTGIGGGLVINRELYEGAHHIAGELGHLVVEWEHPRACGCGGEGCLEAHASGTAIGKRARQRAAVDEAFAAELRRHGLEPTAEGTARAAALGSETARQLYEEAGRYLGRAFAAAANLLNPAAIYVGGGVSLAMELWEPAMRAVYERAVIGASNRSLPIVRTSLGYEAGLLGAASLVFHNQH